MLTNEMPAFQSWQSVNSIVRRDFDFTEALAVGDSISSMAGAISNPSDLTLTQETLGPNPAGVANSVVQLTVAGGSLLQGSFNQTYVITITVNTVDGEVLDMDFLLVIRPRNIINYA
jgi:hypothetical protein